MTLSIFKNIDLNDLSLDTVIYGYTISQYLLALLLLLVIFVIVVGIKKVLAVVARRLILKYKKHVIVELFRSSRKLSMILEFLPFYVAKIVLALPAMIEKAIDFFGIIVIVVSIARCLNFALKLILRRRLMPGRQNMTIRHTIEIFSSVILWGAAVLIILSNLGVNINTLLAGLGIGGMAVALASQTLLSNLFNYFTILMDKPFVVGDEVFVNGYQGTVCRIGIRGTRITGSDGEQIIISNTDMTQETVKNFCVMKRRRKVVMLGIRYDVALEQLKAIPQIVKDIVLSVGGVQFQRIHFKDFAESSLNFELVYYVAGSDYEHFMNAVQEINFKIFEEFSKRNIGFAYPSSSVYIEQAAPQNLPPLQEN
ncbi:MAG: mechanosensitive ion channel family protein [Elusimicrobiota bacterium]|jgi:small-conductance mechanosensitive channel|nr:mechanosensitive ion channel family protein [Elusimicrobiota bacterium]